MPNVDLSCVLLVLLAASVGTPFGFAQGLSDEGLLVELSGRPEYRVTWEDARGRSFACEQARVSSHGECTISIPRLRGLHVLRVSPISDVVVPPTAAPGLWSPVVREEVPVELSGEESQIRISRRRSWRIAVDLESDVLEVSPSGDPTCPWSIRNRDHSDHSLVAVTYGAGTLTAVAVPQARFAGRPWIDVVPWTPEPHVGTYTHFVLGPGETVCAAVPDSLQTSIVADYESRVVLIADEHSEAAGLAGSSYIVRRALIPLPTVDAADVTP